MSNEDYMNTQVSENNTNVIDEKAPIHSQASKPVRDHAEVRMRIESKVLDRQKMSEEKMLELEEEADSNLRSLAKAHNEKRLNNDSYSRSFRSPELELENEVMKTSNTYEKILSIFSLNAVSPKAHEIEKIVRNKLAHVSKRAC